MQIIKHILKLVLRIIGFVNLHDAIIKFRLPQKHLKKKLGITPSNILITNNFKIFKFRKSKFVRLKHIKNYINEISLKDYVFDISVDDTNFKMNFNGYNLDSAIIERINGLRETETTSILKSIIKPGFNIIEIGACYGYFTNIVAQSTGIEGMIYSIESSPNNFKILNNNIKLNNLKNVKIYNLFISNLEEEVVFHKDAKNSYEIKLRETSKYLNLENEIIVKSISINNFIKKNNITPDLIFMDIEGCEVEVIEDLNKNYFQIKKPIILFEVHSKYYKNESLNDLKHLLVSNKYNCVEISGNLLCIPNL
tara:strand:+ start:731 stop:1657 length:927 start_codon:yes stop_codon:yes gene_type:complete